MGFLVACVVSAVLVASGYFGAIEATKDNCEKQGYFIYTDENGVEEKHECK